MQLAGEVAAGARAAHETSMRGDLAGGQVLAVEAAGKAATLACLLGGDSACWGGGDGGTGGAGMHLADLDPLDARALARGNPGSVRRLYGEGFPFWCKQDGTRFGTQVQLDAHMDLLFRRKRARREQKGAASREWYCTGEQWMTDFGRLGPPAPGPGEGEAAAGTGGEGGGGGEGGDGDADQDENADPDGAKSCVPADERFSKCRICGDRFLMFYDNDEEEWMYRNACHIWVHGTGGGGVGDDDGGEEDGLAGEDDGGEEGEGGKRKDGARQIIVHKLCLDVSGLRNKEEITWRDLMPGTPRGAKRPGGDGASDGGFFGGEEDDDGPEAGDWADANGSGREGEGGDGVASDGATRQRDGDANGDVVEPAEDEPPLKRVKAEDGEGDERGSEGGGGSDDAVSENSGDAMEEEFDFEA